MTAEEIRKTLQREFVRTIRKPFVDAVKEYDMVRPGDRVAVCISGGKDSMLLGLLLIKKKGWMDFVGNRDSSVNVLYGGTVRYEDF